MHHYLVGEHKRLLVALLGIALVVAVGCSEESKLQVNRLSRDTGIPGDVITFYGTGFQAGGTKDVRVFFNNKKGKVLRIDGNEEIKVEVPGGIDMGTSVDIKVIFEPGGEITLEKAFKYVEPARNTVEDLMEDGKDK